MFFVELIKVTLLSTFNTEENVYGFGEWKKQYQTTNISKLPAGFILVKIISCPAIELLCCVGQKHLRLEWFILNIWAHSGAGVPKAALI